MSKKRMLDLDGLLFDDELVDILGNAEGIIIYQLLWSIADDWGGYEAKFGSIALRSGALRLSKERVQQVIAALIDAGKIIPYQDNGKTYHWIKNFHKHQKLTNPASPTIPLPSWIQFEEESYPSGKKYAKYKILNDILIKHLQENTGRLPEDYWKTTGNLEKKRKEREEERKEGVRSAPSSPREPETPPAEPSQDSQPGEKIAQSAKPKFGPAELVALWNEAGCRPQVQKLTDDRRRKITARVRERADPAWWREFFEKVRGLQERGRKWLNIDWVIKNENNLLKVIEGNYDEDFEGGKKRAIAGNHQQRAAGDRYYTIRTVQPAAG
jgi:hypothetical protein